MFSQAAASRIIPYDPALRLTLPTVTQGRRRSLTDEERTVLLKVAQTHRCGLWIRFLLDTGLRPGESAPLKWMDIDLDRKEGPLAVVLPSNGPGNGRGVLKIRTRCSVISSVYVCVDLFAGRLFQQASAAIYFPGSKRFGCFDRRFPAVAEAFPAVYNSVAFRLRKPRRSYNDETPKPLSS